MALEYKEFPNEPFTIKMYFGIRHIPVTLTKIYSSETYERLEVKGKEQNIIIQNNRPEMRRLNKNTHKFKWKLFSGPVTIPQGFLKSLFQATEDYIENFLEGGNAARQAYVSKKR